MKLYISIPALVAAGLLSACDSTTPAAVSQIDAGLAFVAALEEGDIQPVAVEDLPDNATMNGYLAATNNLEGGTVYVGDAAADFNFASGNIVGTASNFNEFQLAEACVDGLEACTGEKTRELDGFMMITGVIEETSFDYYAQGALSSNDDEFGALVAEVYLSGEGEIFELDGKLTAAGTGDGTAYVYSAELDNDSSSSNTGDSVEFDLENLLVLQE
jgi:hypothetical protein